MAEQDIGKVSTFFARPVVAGIELISNLSVGDTVHIKGHTTDIEFPVHSMQVNNKEVQHAEAGASVGIKVPDRVRPGDQVFKIT